MSTRVILFVAAALVTAPPIASAQQNVPQPVQQATAQAEETARRFGVGVQGGIGLDPELINFGAHATFGPFARPAIQIRPGIEFGLGELTTLFGINVDVLYTFSGVDGRWLPYVGAGPNFALSHRNIDEADLLELGVDIEDIPALTDDEGRFDFGDTDFTGGMNFIIGMRRESGMLFEMKATAWGVSNVRLLAGFSF